MTNFMAQWVYSPQVKDHFMNPRNTWDADENFEADGVGDVGSLACGDQMRIGIKVEDDKIVDLRWLTYGCASAIASTSMMSEMVIGMSLKDAYFLTPEEITNALGGLPEHKFHCSVLGDKGLRAAIEDYLKKAGRENTWKDEIAQIICECKSVTDVQVEELVKNGEVTTLEELAAVTGYGTVCGNCKEDMATLFEELTHIYNV